MMMINIGLMGGLGFLKQAENMSLYSGLCIFTLNII